MCRKLSHLGGPLRMSPLDHRLLILHFLLHNEPCCQAGTCSLITSTITVNNHLTVRVTGFFRAIGFFSNATLHCSSSSKHLCTLCTGVASQRTRSNSPLGQSGKSTPQCQWQSEPPCLANGNSPSVTSFQCYLVTTASQSSTGAYVKRITATWYHMLYGSHWLPPSSGASGFSACLVS